MPCSTSFVWPCHLLCSILSLITHFAVAGPQRGEHHFRVGPSETYRSVEAALEAAKALRATDARASIRIELSAGDHYVAAPLRIAPELSGTAKHPTSITAASAEGGRPRLLAGRRLQLQWAPYRDGIQRALVDGPAFDQLYINDVCQTRARYPDQVAGKLPLGGCDPEAIGAERAARWSHPEDGIVHAMHAHYWGSVVARVLGRAADGTVQVGPVLGNNRPEALHPQDRFVENVFEELDAPGEWFYDVRESTLYYYPPSGVDLSNAKVEVSGAMRLFDVEGTAERPVHDVNISGLFLGHTGTSFLECSEPLLRSDWMIARQAAVFVEHAESIRISDNELTQLGGNGVFVSGQARNVNVSGNHIHDIGASAVVFIGRPAAVRSAAFGYEHAIPFDRLDRERGPATKDHPASCSASDNLIHDIGTIEKQAAGVCISMAMDIAVLHNSIYRVPRAGINICDGLWGGHDIAFNDVFETVLETGDHGAFNSWGRDRFWQPERHVMDSLNLAHPGLWKLDALEPIVIRNNRFRCDHGWDIDLDDGASNYRIHDNLLLSGGLKLREGFDRRAWNNIMLNNGFHPHVWFKNSGDRFERNVVMAAHQPILVKYWGSGVDHNLLPTAKALANARALGIDAHSFAGDPGFRDPKHHDLRVDPQGPASRIGFKDLDTSCWGVCSPALRVLAERPGFPELITPQMDSVELVEWLGAQVKTVSTLGERSAAGLPDTRGVIILDVPDSSQAGAQGLRPGDVIVGAPAGAWDSAETIDTVTDLLRLCSVRRWRGGVLLRVYRDQHEQTIKVLFGS